MTAAKLDLFLEQGATYKKNLLWTDKAGSPITLVGYTAKLQVRETYAAEDVILELTDSAGLTLGGVDGTIQILIDADTTTGLTPGGKVGVYDLELYPPTETTQVVIRLMRGSVSVSPEVTRA